MDLIGQLSQQLGVNGTQAQGLAGSLLKRVQGTVQEKLGPDAANQMGQAIPEMETGSRPPAPRPRPRRRRMRGRADGRAGRPHVRPGGRRGRHAERAGWRRGAGR
ncbi:DUF2780 domain-containing protein [Myxococcus sp. MxC21-1]|uniref:DUF2780 domain-containing protein n=1 Tax=Myxococcus sp. MxC21-1 TaxID=3041439 RepID=UPI00292F3868|nr:DUF2780 domain-containing protein [Myxococcus sp. MxC21-1]WNZ63302.1 DUF2780 domain-containing protein [Myxococcus sp. MxC21-1]